MTVPLVAVTGRRLPIGRVDRWLEPALASPTYYSDGVHRAGGVSALLLPVDLDAAGAAAVMQRFDALVATGGPDVTPDLYGAERDPRTYDTDEVEDRFEIALMQAAIAAGKPLLAICRGHQLLNVAYGGTLHQHISDTPGVGLHGVPNGGGGSAVTVQVEPDSTLAVALGGTAATGNCHHHQAIDRVGVGLRVVARAPDGVVEAVEPPDAPGWVVSVQWHPEDSADRDPQQQALFDHLVAATSVRS